MKKRTLVFTHLSDGELQALARYRQRLSAGDRVVFDEMIRPGRRFMVERGHLPDLSPMELVLISGMLDLGRKLIRMKKESDPIG